MMNEYNKEMEKTVSNLINEEDMKRIDQEAEEFIEKIQPAGYDELADIMQKLGNLGEREQKSAGESLNALNRPLKELMKNGKNGKNTEIPDSLLKIRSEVNQLNPEAFNKKGIAGLITRILKKDNIDQYMSKYQSVERNIEEIIKGLLRGQDKLQENNADLEMIRRDSQEKMYNLKKQVYYGKQLLKILDEKKNNEEWKNKENIITDAQEKISTRTRDMELMINVFLQSMGAIDLIKKDNERLREAIRSSIDITKNLAPVSAIIHVALLDQKRIIKSVNAVREAQENLLVANAKMLKENTEETSKLLENPAIRFEKAKQAFNDLYSAIEMQESSAKRIIEESKRYIEDMGELNDEIAAKIIK